MGHIPTKLHQFLISSFLDFVRTDTHTPAETIPARSMRAGKYTLQWPECSKQGHLLKYKIFTITFYETVFVYLSKPIAHKTMSSSVYRDG